ncbi:hypothetical protein IW261DRAFT_1338897 [Armillaria novae-zelandiae]|uniref:Uncharacterized protein n=1 Tax=Armillaria novae-zelandiae TaxID=153914 RepID=A0AA39U466_9AGAR|nr:hypothetical protein IW261DRAFT_1338897 [Armillaria novae-zelandiae]
MAEALLSKKGIEWRSPTLGLLLACCLPTYKSESGKRDTGKERLYRLVMSISIQVIWSIRCKRVISKENVPIPANVVETTWLRAMNDRLEMDYLMTHRNFGRRALKPQTVLRTWKGTLEDEEKLPSDWTGVAGVLVGIGPSQGR